MSSRKIQNAFPRDLVPQTAQVRASFVDFAYFVVVLIVFNALPFLLGTQPAKLNASLAETTDAGDANKQALLLGLYLIGGVLFLLRTRLRNIAAFGLPLTLLLVWCFASAFWSDVPDLTFRRYVALLGTVIVGAYAGFTIGFRDAARAISIVAATVLSLSLVVAILWPAYGYDFEGRLRGVFADKNGLAHLAALALFVISACSFERGHLAPVRLLRDGVLFLVCVVGIVLSQSATPIPTLTGGLFCLALARICRSRNRTSGLAFLTIISGLFFLCGLGYVFTSENPAGLLGRDATLSDRTYVWTFALDKALDRPLLGYGYGTFWSVEGPGALLWNLGHLNVLHAHNGYLQLLLDGGAIGLALLFAAIVLVLIRTWRLLLFSNQPYVGLGFGLIGFYLVLNLAESRLLVGNDFMTALFVYVSVRTNLAYFVATGSAAGRQRSTSINFAPPREGHGIGSSIG